MSGHPELAALERHRVEPDPALADHVAGCPECTATLDALGAQAALAGELRATLRRGASRSSEPTPPCIEGYEDLRLVSVGGQGIVWRARQTATRRDVALKLLVGAAYASPRTRARFEREIELAASLNHPHLVTVFDSGEAADGAQWFAMEYIEGRPFVRWAREGRVRAADEVIACAIALCRAVDAAHRRGVLHRDLKSSNVLVDAEGAPHVLDFGLAASSELADDGAARLTHTGEFMGTLAYASPEHVSGDPRRIEARSDVYSLGVLVYEALTGRLPRDVSGSTLAAAQRIASHDIDRAPLLGLPRDLATILTVALARDPERRYPSAGAYADDLQRFLEGRAIDARRDHPVYVLRKVLARHRWQVAAALIVFVAAVAASIVSLSLWRRAEHSRQLAVDEAARANVLSRFWRSIFDAIDPDQAEGRRIDVREVLDHAASGLADEPPESALAELELALSIGRTYHKLGRNKEAWRHLGRAAELAAESFAAGDPRRAGIASDAATVALIVAPLPEAQRAVASLAGLGVAAHTHAYLRALLAEREGDPTRALSELSSALAALDDASDTADVLGASGVLGALATAASDRGDSVLAEAYARRAVEFATLRGGPDGTRALFAKLRLAFIIEPQAEAGRDEALQLLDDVVTGLGRRYGVDDTGALNAAVARAIVRGRRDGLEAVRSELDGFLALRPELVRRQGRNAALTLGAIADFAEDLGDLAVARAVWLDALDVYRGLDDDNLDGLVNAHLGLAQVGVLARDLDFALSHADEALALLGPTSDARARDVARAWITRATALALLQRTAEAEEAAQRAIGVVSNFTDESAFTKAIAERALALAFAMGGKLDSAEVTLREALARFGAEPAPGIELVAALQDDLGDVLLQRFRPAEAEVVLRDALERRRLLLGARHPETASTATKLGVALFEQSKGPPELPGLWTDAVAVFEERGLEGPALANALNNLGAWAHVVERVPARAEELMRRGLAVGERVHGPEHPLLAASLANVASFDLQRGDVAAATSRVERSLAIMEARYDDANPRVQQLRAMLAECRRRAAEPGK